MTESSRWFTSSYSSNGGQCVEVAANLAATRGIVPIRDSKNRAGPTLRIPVQAFAAFVVDLKTTGMPHWFTSSYSSNGGACVEVATDLAASRGIVPIRDSKNPAGPVLTVPAGAFAAFVAAVKG